jgi:Ca2+-transporting ATPase
MDDITTASDPRYGGSGEGSNSNSNSGSQHQPPIDMTSQIPNNDDPPFDLHDDEPVQGPQGVSQRYAPLAACWA